MFQAFEDVKDCKKPESVNHCTATLTWFFGVLFDDLLGHSVNRGHFEAIVVTLLNLGIEKLVEVLGNVLVPLLLLLGNVCHEATVAGGRDLAEYLFENSLVTWDIQFTWLWTLRILLSELLVKEGLVRGVCEGHGVASIGGLQSSLSGRHF